MTMRKKESHLMNWKKPSSTLDTVGMTQRMIFEDGDDPPLQGKNANPYNREMRDAEKAKETFRRQKRRKTGDIIETIDGYVGANKGIFQVLYERGKYLADMQGKQTQGVEELMQVPRTRERRFVHSHTRLS